MLYIIWPSVQKFLSRYGNKSPAVVFTYEASTILSGIRGNRAGYCGYFRGSGGGVSVAVCNETAGSILVGWETGRISGSKQNGRPKR